MDECVPTGAAPIAEIPAGAANTPDGVIMSSQINVLPEEKLTTTWERLIPKQLADDPASRRLMEIHVRRYEEAARFVRGQRVLDIACGVGYGSQLLGRGGAEQVVGVDLSPDAIRYAQAHYLMPNIQF